MVFGNIPPVYSLLQMTRALYSALAASVLDSISIIDDLLLKDIFILYIYCLAYIEFDQIEF